MSPKKWGLPLRLGPPGRAGCSTLGVADDIPQPGGVVVGAEAAGALGLDAPHGSRRQGWIPPALGWKIPKVRLEHPGGQRDSPPHPAMVPPNSPGAAGDGVGRGATYWPWLVVNPDGSWGVEMGWVHGAPGTGPCWHPPSRQHPPSCQLSAAPAAWPASFGASAALGRRTRRGGPPRARSVRGHRG